ncbi:hypothetical protein [Glycomyces salinus]|uniref:hypothetical protein n=1 Tax=Glycomyces salinus TaxID=980294 RepID=UPI0018ED93FF|nr:hypothetical protein [Glycomyces salinus]
MAGHRRGTGRPKQARARIERRRAALADKLAAAHTPAAQVGVCADYLRSALKRAEPDHAAATAEEACALLRGLADRLAFETWEGAPK